MERVEAAVAIDIPVPLVTSTLQKKLDALSDEQAADHFTVFRVPAHIRERNKHLYEPRMVAIGPYGCRDKPSLRTTESLKLRYLQEFLKKKYGGNRSINDYLALIQELEPRARQCYFEPIELTKEEFVEMLLLDGCFIIEFLIKWNNEEYDKDMFAAEWSTPLIRDDLLLLENQIPLFVLEKLSEGVTAVTVDGEILSLMELLEEYLTAMTIKSPKEKTKSSKEGMKCSLMKFLKYLTCMNVGSSGKQAPSSNVPHKPECFHHLLHHYYHCSVTEPQTDSKQQTQSMGGCDQSRSPRTTQTDSKQQTQSMGGCDQPRLPRTIPTATKLLEAGVTIKKKKEEKKNQNQQSRSKKEEKKNQNQQSPSREKKKENRRSSFLDVTFSNGVLEIPFLSVDNSTLPWFSNLVAFEQCSRCKPKEAYMTSYAVFMDCLINTREDVAVLHQSGVLENKLASDKELAIFFNQLSDWATLDYDKHYLAKLFCDVEAYCGSTWPRWRAILVRNYFSNPWAIISLIAAAVLLILTILQTFYSIYAYYHPS